MELMGDVKHLLEDFEKVGQGKIIVETRKIVYGKVRQGYSTKGSEINEASR